MEVIKRRVPPIGLFNKTCNGCYVNSVIQFIMSSSVIVDQLFCSQPKNEVVQRVKLLCYDLCNSGYDTVDTFYFLDNYEPNTGDPNEFLMMVLFELGECKVTLKKDIKAVCKKCGKEYAMKSCENYWTLNNMENEHDLEVIIQRHSDVMWCCEEDQPCEVTYQAIPETIVFLVNNICENNGQLKKIEKSVSQNRVINIKGVEYSLIAMISHIGWELVGHCRCYTNTELGWFCADDTNVYKWNGCLNEGEHEVIVAMLYQKTGTIDPKLCVDGLSITEDYFNFLNQKKGN
ncbi:hypothetical protein EIN_391660 [Entamoeba invadens IP1]|uniref:USP domain-containing protein n=1 Tax=Entamoeba invadens IP1 TaxID=370355 RepID=A0A0A1UBD0_ENTIV|nr:hypothetical protein EIN_391660 [Entamoeba invadens IP1]ELP89511.1 hypothetical protein EIN_391660 [Entamoeba invadens IP1]|eukprot:XP_004256282.1 hypothetical protein EIN_391660 [Entamoeba invadens IP1]